MPSRGTGIGAVEGVAGDNPAKKTTVPEHRGGVKTQFAGSRPRTSASVVKRWATVLMNALPIDRQRSPKFPGLTMRRLLPRERRRNRFPNRETSSLQAKSRLEAGGGRI